jgi:hypothetical protein
MSKMTPQETVRIQQYLQKTFSNSGITLRAREKAADSVEVLLNGEFIGTIYKDEEDGDTSYDFNMAILGIDLAA